MYDLKIHPRDRELIAATHGRGFWIANIAPLEQLTPGLAATEPYLFEPKTAYQWGEPPNVLASANGNAQAFFATASPPYGAEISYRLPAGSDSTPVRIQIWSASGDTLATIAGPGRAGIHSVVWNFQGRAAPAPALTPSERRDSILKAVRAPRVLDSLRAAGYDSVALARVRTLLNPPPAGGRGGRGGGAGGGRGALPPNCERPLTQWDPFCARPGEGTVVGGRAGAGQTGEAVGGPGGPEPANVIKVFQLIGIRPPATGGRGGGAGGGGRGGIGGSVVGAGDYLVTMTVGGRTFRQVLHVEPTSGR